MKIDSDMHKNTGTKQKIHKILLPSNIQLLKKLVKYSGLKKDYKDANNLFKMLVTRTNNILLHCQSFTPT